MRHPPLAPEAPMIIDGSISPGDPRLMLRCMLEELIGAGCAAAMIRSMSQDPNYQGLYAARMVVGPALFERMVEEAAARVGVHRCRIQERAATDFPADLTVSVVRGSGPRAPQPGGSHA